MPPTPTGAYNREMLATCHELEITEVYRLGGAQAIAAMAYGVDGIKSVDMIVGPGSTPVLGLVAYSAISNSLTFNPAANLAPSTTYTATFGGAQDLSGNAMAAVSWTPGT